MDRISEILDRLRTSGGLGGVERWNYTAGMGNKELLEEVEAVGRFRTDAFAIDKGLQFAYENIARWYLGDALMTAQTPGTKLLERGDLRKGIYLTGRTGCGKTWAMEIFAYLAGEHRMKVNIAGKTVSLAPKQCRADEITDAFMRNGEITAYVDAPVLLINDLGTEPEEVLYMGNRVDVLRLVLERRADSPRLTLITSNLPLYADAVKERYGDRVVSRLHQMCNYLEMTGNDKRIG